MTLNCEALNLGVFTGFGRDVFVERAKWHWVKGEHHQAVTTLHRGIDKFYSFADAIKKGISESSHVSYIYLSFCLLKEPEIKL